MRLSLLLAATLISTALGRVINIEITANGHDVQHKVYEERDRDSDEPRYRLIHRAGAGGDRDASHRTMALVARGANSERVEELLRSKQMIRDAIAHMERHMVASNDPQERQDIEAVRAQYEARSTEIDGEIAGGRA